MTLGASYLGHDFSMTYDVWTVGVLDRRKLLLTVYIIIPIYSMLFVIIAQHMLMPLISKTYAFRLVVASSLAPCRNNLPIATPEG